MYVALNPNEKLHIICALSWPSDGHFVCLMTTILVYRLSKVMFASHRGIYLKILHGCYQNQESAFILLIINFWFSQMAAIFSIIQLLKYFPTTPLCRAYLKTLWWTHKLCFCVHSVENGDNLLQEWRPSWILTTMHCPK